MSRLVTGVMAISPQGTSMGRLPLLIATIAIVIAAPALGLPQPEAEEAYARGDYATAFKLWLPLAEQGSARAQANIGRMYERGEWVAQDQAMANDWYRRAVEQSAQDAAINSAPAQQLNPPVQTHLHTVHRATNLGKPLPTASAKPRVFCRTNPSPLSRRAPALMGHHY
jgi:hypothetical protein